VTASALTPPRSMRDRLRSETTRASSLAMAQRLAAPSPKLPKRPWRVSVLSFEVEPLLQSNKITGRIQRILRLSVQSISPTVLRVTRGGGDVLSNDERSWLHKGWVAHDMRSCGHRRHRHIHHEPDHHAHHTQSRSASPRHTRIAIVDGTTASITTITTIITHGASEQHYDYTQSHRCHRNTTSNVATTARNTINVHTVNCA
jgi:hypothetical protein